MGYNGLCSIRTWIDIGRYSSRYGSASSYVPLNVFGCDPYKLDLKYKGAHQVGVL